MAKVVSAFNPMSSCSFIPVTLVSCRCSAWTTYRRVNTNPRDGAESNLNGCIHVKFPPSVPSKYQTRDQSQACPSRLSQPRANTYESMLTRNTTRGDSNGLKSWLERLYFQFDAPNVVKRAYAKTCRPPSKYGLDVYLTSNNAARSPFTV